MRVFNRCGRCFFMVVVLGVMVGSAHYAGAKSVQGGRQPNVIFILCDDLGWGDFGVLHQNDSGHSKRHQTPAIDRMALEGTQLRAHYCGAPVCAPSRATLLSGVHQGHAEVRDNQFDKALADNHTVASVLRDAGYRTWMVGKHGLQGAGDNPSEWTAYPTKRGFEEFYGYVRHGDGHVHYPADRWLLGNSEAHRSVKEVWHNDQEVSAGLSKCYTTDLFTARGKKYIVDHVQAGSSQPFFLYLAYDTPHAALQLPTGSYPEGNGLDGGVQWIGEPGRMINTAKGEIDDYRHPDYSGQGWQDVEVRFATMIRRIDQCVGDLLQTLRDLEIDQETIVVITSDNGPLNVSYLAGQPIEATSFQSYGPFEGIKRDVWEGGIRMATVAWGPGYIPPGTLDDHPSQMQDWMATFADFAGVIAPARCDGVSLRPSLTGQGKQRPSSIYVEYKNGGRTPRYDDFEVGKRGQKRGQMQIVHVDGLKGVRVNIQSAQDPFEIYDLSKDPQERNNLAGSNQRFKDLQQRMLAVTLRGRRVNPSAPRPYDHLPVPSIALGSDVVSKLKIGTQGRFLKGDFSYVPDLRGVQTETLGHVGFQMPDAFEVKPFDASRKRLGALELKGWLKIENEGQHQFRIRASERSFIRLHKMALLDLDFSQRGNGTVETSVSLGKGWHPIRITTLTSESGNHLTLDWKTPKSNQWKKVPSDSCWSE